MNKKHDGAPCLNYKRTVLTILKAFVKKRIIFSFKEMPSIDKTHLYIEKIEMGFVNGWLFLKRTDDSFFNKSFQNC